MSVQTHPNEDATTTRWYTPGEVAAMLNLPYTHVLARLKAGLWPGSRRGAGGRRCHVRCNLEHVDRIRQILAAGDLPPTPLPQPPLDPLRAAIEATRERHRRHPGPRKR